MKNRNLGNKALNTLLKLQLLYNTILGDCSMVDGWLADKPIISVWSPLHYLNVFLRSIAQVGLS